MKPNDLTAEISALEAQLQHHQNLLDQAFSDNRQFAETKIIFHEVKILSDKLIILKNLGNDELKIIKNGERANSHEL